MQKDAQFLHPARQPDCLILRNMTVRWKALVTAASAPDIKWKMKCRLGVKSLLWALHFRESECRGGDCYTNIQFNLDRHIKLHPSALPVSLNEGTKVCFFCTKPEMKCVWKKEVKTKRIVIPLCVWFQWLTCTQNYRGSGQHWGLVTNGMCVWRNKCLQFYKLENLTWISWKLKYENVRISLWKWITKQTNENIMINRDSK